MSGSPYRKLPPIEKCPSKVCSSATSARACVTVLARSVEAIAPKPRRATSQAPQPKASKTRANQDHWHHARNSRCRLSDFCHDRAFRSRSKTAFGLCCHPSRLSCCDHPHPQNYGNHHRRCQHSQDEARSTAFRAERSPHHAHAIFNTPRPIPKPPENKTPRPKSHRLLTAAPLPTSSIGHPN